MSAGSGTLRTGGPASLAVIAAVFLTAGCGAGSMRPTPDRPRSPDSQMVAYAVCMRSHGLPSFPDPSVSANGEEQFRFSPGSGANPESPAFSGAQRHCQQLLPHGAPGGPVAPEKRQQFVQYSACMRAHGLPAFPDPRFGSGTVTIALGNLIPASPAFQAAERSCQTVMPGFRGFEPGSSGAAIRAG
jgi:hypothetical protein